MGLIAYHKCREQQPCKPGELNGHSLQIAVFLASVAMREERTKNVKAAWLHVNL